MNTDELIDPAPLIESGENSDAVNDEHYYGLNNESTLIITNNTCATTGAFCSTKLYLSELSRIFSLKFLYFVSIYGFFIIGGSYPLVMAICLPLFKQMGITASRQQLYTSMLKSPRAMKPFVGVVSDLFPIMGYNMRCIALFAILIGCLATLVLLRTYPLVDITMKQQGPNDTPSAETIVDTIIMPCFVAISSLAATFGILVQGKYSQIMRNHPGVGTSITTFKYFMESLGIVVVQSYVGPLSNKGDYMIFFWIILAYSITPLLPTLLGWIPEQKRTNEEPGMIALCGQLIMFDNGAFQEKKAAFMLITFSGLCPILFVLIICLAGPDIGLVSALLLIAIFCTATFFMFPQKFFWIFVSIIINQLSLAQITSVLGYYYTANEQCVPNGPHFDYTYYITLAGAVGSTMSLFSVVLYQKLFAKWRFRSAIAMTICAGTVGAMADIIVINRWNIKIGIPDKVFFMFGNALFAQMITTLKIIPLDAICSKMSPPGMGSTISAYLLGTFEFCGLVSNLLGSRAIDWIGIKTMGEDCNFTALPYLVLVTQIVIPITIGIPAIFLIPNVYQTENLIDWEKEGWYSERIDRLVVSGLLPNIYCNDDDDDDNSNDVSSNERAITEQRII